MQKLAFVAASLFAVAGVVMYWPRTSAPRSEPAAPTGPKPCVLTTSADAVYVFDEEAGAKEFSAAIRSKSLDGVNAALAANKPATVAPGARCTRIGETGGFGEYPFVRIRILDGPHAHMVGWVRLGETEPR